MHSLFNSFINKIILFTLIIVGFKWAISFAYFPHEDLSLKVILESITSGYFHYVKVLSDLIVRYYYNPGRIQASLKEDPYIIEAKKILNNSDHYFKILSP